MISAWQIGVIANLIVAVAYLAIFWSILRPLLRDRSEGLNLLGVATAALFLSCAVHHSGHALVVASMANRHESGFALSMVAFDVVTMSVGLYYWSLRRGYGRLMSGGQLFADLQAERSRAAEQAALRQVATAVAEDRSPDAVFAQVADGVAELLGAECGLVARFDESEALVVGSHGEHGTRLGWRFPLSSAAALGRVSRGGGVVHVEYDTLTGDDVADSARALGYVRGIAAPVRVGGRIWGAVLVATTRHDGLAGAGLDARLSSFGELVGLSVANADVRAQMAEAAATDPLTGLSNYRVFQEQLAAESARATRHGRPLSLLVLDLDHFKVVNDDRGHPTGDRVLIEVAARLSSMARKEDLIARIGGEEFAVLMPDTDELEAFQVAERMRQAIGRAPFGDAGRLTISGGICSLERALSGNGLARLADGALYWAKANGRDVCFIYNPDVVEALSAEERTEKRVRGSTLAGLRALAQAVDARDPSTRAHSERVADVAIGLASELGWGPQACARLHEAGLVHDVGKIGVPDAVLLKPGPLTPEEYDLIKLHVPLGVQIVQEVLDDEQVTWVRQHHERHDGRGYPAGVGGDRLEAGSAILATADSWDAMTASRPYRGAMGFDDAMAEIRRERGAQFAPDVVDAFLRLPPESLCSPGDAHVELAAASPQIDNSASGASITARVGSSRRR